MWGGHCGHREPLRAVHHSADLGSGQKNYRPICSQQMHCLAGRGRKGWTAGAHSPGGSSELGKTLSTAGCLCVFLSVCLYVCLVLSGVNPGIEISCPTAAWGSAVAVGPEPDRERERQTEREPERESQRERERERERLTPAEQDSTRGHIA